jgi:L-fucose isomerase-like protein
MERGIVKIKPVYIGIHHYRDVYGSVCSADVVGTPPIPAPRAEDLAVAARGMVDRFKEDTGQLDFVQVTEPLIIREHRDMRELAAALTYDTDALLVGTIARTPLELYTLAQYGLPILSGRVSAECLWALRVKKFLKESKFLYIGEIPSFSAPDGPYDFPTIEKRLGVRVRHIETNELYRHFDRFSEEEVKQELEDWRRQFDQVLEPDEHELMNATRVYLALRYLVEREDANGLTINCGRFTEERPVVPCLAFDRLIDEGVMCACEGDVTAMLSSLILHAVNGQPVLMGNFGYRPGAFEAREGEVTLEHDIIPLSMASTGFTIRDYHGRKFGITAYADIEANQPMTLLNLDSALDRICVIEGTIKGSEDGIHCRIIIHMDVDGDVEQVPQILAGSQHYSMTFGHWADALQETAAVLGFAVERLRGKGGKNG